MKADLNERITRIGPSTPCGNLMRHYWQPVALLDEFDPVLDPRMATRPVKAVRLLGQDMVLFRDEQGQFALLDRDCPHRGADLSFGRYEGDGLRCPFHGWKFDSTGQCIETPAEPTGSKLCTRIKQRQYPLLQRSGVLFGWFGPEDQTPPPFPALDCFVAPDSHTFAFKGLWRCNWLQAFEVGIDPAHTSFLHRFFNDESLDDTYGKQFRAASVGDVNGERWPMTKIMREFHQPKITVDAVPFGMRLTTLREMTDDISHVRVTHSIFPHTFVIPLSETMTITQMHVPVDDENTYWVSIFTSFDKPVNKDTMRNQRTRFISLPDYVPNVGKHNQWGYNPEEQATRTYLGMGEDDINSHDQWACESMGRIQDRTREHLGTSDVAIMANRRTLLKAIDAVANGETPVGFADPGVATQRFGPDTVDGIAPAAQWQQWWQDAAAEKRKGAPWNARIETAAAVD